MERPLKKLILINEISDKKIYDKLINMLKDSKKRYKLPEIFIEIINAEIM